jgi:DNA-binding CsgD family transcriptional regulator
MKVWFLMGWMLLTTVAMAASSDSLLIRLNKTIDRKEEYTKTKLNHLEDLHQQLNRTPAQDDEARFHLLQEIAEEYKAFIYDSAFINILKLQRLAYKMNDPVRISYARVKLGFILLSSGMFKETIDTLSRMRVQGLPDSIRVDYYAILARTYYDLGDFDRDGFYTQRYTALGNKYVDSAKALCRPNDYNFVYLSGLKNLKNENTREALANLNQLLNEYKLTPHQLAVTASTLSYFYISRNEPDQAIHLLAQAAIADIISATKETAAMSSLAEQLYNRGDLMNAYTFIQQAMDDAIFYGARQRKVQVGSILPVIAAAKVHNVDEQRRRWLIYSTALTVLAILVIVFAVVIYKQLEKLKRTEKALLEANTIKEEYIGYYFNINSEYLGKIEAFKKAVEMKLITKKLEDIKFIVNNINVKKEREELYFSFDKVFLKLFPDFITVFNSYFKEEDRIVLKEGQLMNTELRIFALIRMGIHDTEKIAKILDYSINTIYNYKARIKGKSIVPNEKFEQKIMEIQTV